jgi:hypothetical protein
MTDSFGMGWKKIYYRTIRHKLGNIVISKQASDTT